MAKRSISLELDDETLHYLAALGEPAEVLAHLAYSAADGVRSPIRPRREQTDDSLRAERDKSDAAIASERAALDDVADGIVRLARERADQVVETARTGAALERDPRPGATEARSQRARNVLEHERSDADSVVEDERAGRRTHRAETLAVERKATDKDLIGERTHADALIVDQREANEQMVRATIRAQELEAEAETARQRAEERERELRTVAEFREMFIGILGHDLRNPLGSIVMAAALLFRRGNLNEQDAETVTRIIRGSQRIERMITQLLDLTRARLGGGLPIEVRQSDLREICRDVVDEFDATIELKLAGDLTGAWDHDRLAEALSNLLGNAVEYSTPGTLVIVDARGAADEVVVEVTNEGESIPAEALPSIFEPFRRARRREKSETGNLGLGLYIASQIVQAHGGTLAVRSGGGTTSFLIHLPRRPPPREERRKPDLP